MTEQKFHPVCLNLNLIAARDGHSKYSPELFKLLSSMVKRFGAKAMPADLTREQRKEHQQRRKLAKAQALSQVRVLLIADSTVGDLDLMTSGRLYIVQDPWTTLDDDGLLISIKGARLDRCAELRHSEFTPAPFLEVTNLFWDHYLLYGKCAKNSMNFREHNHLWNMVTRTSKRCVHCGMWSYRRNQMTLVTHKAHAAHLREDYQERTVRQVPVWDHQVSRAFSSPYLRLLRTEVQS